MTPVYRMDTSTKREKSVHEFTTMQLVHYSNQELVNALSLAPVHQRLEYNASKLANSGSSNILVCSVSFDCLVTDVDEETTYRIYPSFHLKIPSVNTDKESVFVSDLLVKMYGSKAKLYQAMKHLYELGRSVANDEGYKHGHEPEYDSTTSKHDQYILHTEQLLCAYFALPQAAYMLCNRLVTEIRARHVNAAAVTVFNMGVHFQSTKTCCAPCEYCLIGLMNDDKGVKQRGVKVGFIPNFKKACKEATVPLKLKVSKKPAFVVLTTATVSEADAHHRKQPTYKIKELKEGTEASPHKIRVKKAEATTKIHTALVESVFNKTSDKVLSCLSDITVCISGSKSTPGSSATATKVKAVREEEMKELEELMAHLRLSSK